MARRRYYRYSRRVIPKKKWASNIVQATVTSSTSETIVVNSAQSSAPTPVIVKCGNFKVQGDVMVAAQPNNPRPVGINFFLLFVPEGVQVSDSLIGAHPEWVMAWRVVDVPLSGTHTSGVLYSPTAAFSVTSRLKRNLNSGDRVVAILQSRDSNTSAQCVFTCQYWTCAN